MRRNRPLAPPIDDAADVRARWSLLREFAMPACDPPLPESHPLSLLADRYWRASKAGGWPNPTTVMAAVVAASAVWLAELGLTEEFADFERRHSPPAPTLTQ